MKATLEKFAPYLAPSGYEAPLRDALQAEIAALNLSAEVDALGSLIVHPTADATELPRLLLSAPLDEVGLIVSHVDKQGRARLQLLGAAEAGALLGAEVRFRGGGRGLIVREKWGEAVTAEDLLVELAPPAPDQTPVGVGEVGVVVGELRAWGERWSGHGLGSRAAAVMLLEVLRQVAHNPLAGVTPVFVFAAQHQVGDRGLIAAATRLQPRWALALEPVAVHPEREQDLGAGAVILNRLNGMQTDAAWRDELLDLAAAASTPHWVEIGERQYSERNLGSRGTGVQAVGLGIPCRYARTPFEMIDLGDLAQGMNLLTTFLRQPGRWAEGAA